ncbi:MAG: MarR family winged helix-turn-helix transcriptional regulator [Myxococcaceae bacterium]
MDSRTPLGDRLSKAIVQLFVVNGRLMESGDALAGASGHSSARWRVLAAIEAGVQTASAIAQALGQARQSVQRVVDDLKENGALVAKPNPADKRAPRLELTAAGRVALQQIQKRQVAWANKAAARLGSKGLSALEDGLAALHQALELHPNEGDER